MKAYILTIVISSIFAIIAEEFLKKEKKFMGILNICIFLFILCFLAGVRDLSVGTDIYFYFYQLFNDFTHSNIGVWAEHIKSGVDIGFVIVVYLSHFFNNINIAMFIVELAILIPLCIYAYKSRNNYSLAFIIIIYCLTMYVRSFNIMRQSIAISLLILGTYYFEKKEKKKFIITFLIAILMHKTAIVGLTIYLLLNISKKEQRIRFTNIFILYIAFLVAIIFLEPFLSFVGSRYLRYFSSNVNNESNFSILRFMKKLMWLFISTYMYFLATKQNKVEERNNLFVAINLFVMDMIIALIAIKIPGIGRFTYYFTIYGYIITCCNMVKLFKQKELAKFLTIVLLTYLWIKMTAIINSGDGTYPYISEICKFLN